MSKLLSIVIPTFNRAPELERQLAWLAREIVGFEAECEIIVSDNCSSDRTTDVIDHWQTRFKNTEFHPIKNPQNLGLMKNLAQCLNLAQGRFTWTVGDDDPIKPGTLAFILRSLQQRPDLGLLLLNYAGLAAQTYEVIGERWLPSIDPTQYDGKTVFRKCVEASLVNALFLTATVYRTEYVQAALQQWKTSVNSWGGQAYWTGYCATQADVLITQEILMDCVMGASYWQKEPNVWSRIHYRDIPEIYVYLHQLGYPHEFCRKMLLDHFFAHELMPPLNLRMYGFALKRWPLATFRASLLFFKSLSVSAYKKWILHQKGLYELEPQIPQVKTPPVKRDRSTENRPMHLSQAQNSAPFN